MEGRALRDLLRDPALCHGPASRSSALQRAVSACHGNAEDSIGIVEPGKLEEIKMKKLLTIGVGIALGLAFQGYGASSDNIQCRVVLEAVGGTLGVTILPQTVDGYTIWDLGTAYEYGVKESWYQLGPAYFQVQNSGDVHAYMYMIAQNGGFLGDYWPAYSNLVAALPPPSLGEYSLWYATNATAPAPQYLKAMVGGEPREPFQGYLGYLAAGEYLPFALKAAFGPKAGDANNYDFKVEIVAYEDSPD